MDIPDRNLAAFKAVEGASKSAGDTRGGTQRFGFGGQEKEDEVFGTTGSLYSAEYWMYDSRVGRRWNIDPVTYPWQSPYAAFNNNPVYFVDPSGAQPKKTDPEKPGNPDDCPDCAAHDQLDEIVVVGKAPEKKPSLLKRAMYKLGNLWKKVNNYMKRNRLNIDNSFVGDRKRSREDPLHGPGDNNPWFDIHGSTLYTKDDLESGKLGPAIKGADGNFDPSMIYVDEFLNNLPGAGGAGSVGEVAYRGAETVNYLLDLIMKKDNHTKVTTAQDVENQVNEQHDNVHKTERIDTSLEMLIIEMNQAYTRSYLKDTFLKDVKIEDIDKVKRKKIIRNY